jgi:peptidoglycan/LPS O-acetylase OafA/YrhL
VPIRRLLAPLVVAVALVASFATPASATPILADDDFKWFYWVGPVLVLSLIGLLLLIALGYYLRVLRPKWRGRAPS